MPEEQNEKNQNAEATSANKSPLQWIIIGGFVVLLVAGGFFGWSMYVNSKDSTSEAGEQAPATTRSAKDEKKIVYPLESFIVNLMDKSGMGKRYLKVTVELEVNGEEGKKSIDSHVSQLRDTILLLLSGLSFGEINSIEGKLDLKQALLARINQVLGGGVVQRLYFTEFVVQ